MQNFLLKLRKLFMLSLLTPLFFLTTTYGVETVRIMPLGDSLTSGAWSTYISGYRGPLWTQLSTDNNYSVDFKGGGVTLGEGYKDNVDSTFDIDHEGHGARITDDIANNVTAYLQANPVDIVLLHIGTNDIKDENITSSTMVTNVNTILNNIFSQNKEMEVLIALIIDQVPHSAKTTTFNDELNISMQSRIALGEKISIVDMENGADINYTTDYV